MKRVKNIFKKSVIYLLFFVAEIVFIISFIIASSFSNKTNEDKMYYELANISNNSKGNFEISLRVQYNKDNSFGKYSSAFSYLYYSILVDAARIGVDDETVVNIGGECIKTKILTQPTFSIPKQLEEDSYYLDYGIFSTYFNDSSFSFGNSRTVRNGCESFIFVSDTFADYLVNYYNLENEPNPYYSLIENSDYSTIEITCGEKNIKYCINNVLHSDKRSGPHYKDLFNYYFMTNITSSLKDAQLSFEAELTSSPYSVKKCFGVLDSVGFKADDSKYDVLSFNYETKEQTILKNKQGIEYGQKYREIKTKSDTLSIVFQCLIILLSIAFCFCFVFVFFAQRFNRLLLFATSAFSSILYGIYCLLSYVYITWSIIPLFYLIFSFIVARKELKYGVYRIFKKDCQANASKCFCEIEI